MRSVALAMVASLASSACLVRTAPLSAPTPEPELASTWEAEPTSVAVPPAPFVRARSRGASASQSIVGPSRFQVLTSRRHAIEAIPFVDAPRRVTEIAAVLDLDGGRAWSDEGPTAVIGTRPLRQRPRCLSEDDGALVSFESFKVATSSATELDYGRYAGLAERCQVRATRATRAKIPALERGLLYAYQTCGAAPDCAERTLALVTPRAAFVASEGRFTQADREMSKGSFALSQLPLRRGEATAATVNLEGQAIVEWRVSWGQPSPTADDMPMIASRTLSLRVESVWPVDEASPSISTIVSVDGVPSRNLAAFLGLVPKD